MRGPKATRFLAIRQTGNNKAQVLLADADNPQARSAYATFVARVTGDYDVAEGLYQSALAADPTDVVTLAT